MTWPLCLVKMGLIARFRLLEVIHGRCAIPRRPALVARVPAPPTPLIGRERELETLAAILLRPEVRLLTLTGPSGVCKTRLALGVAANLADFPDGARFVSLAPVHDPALLAPVMAQALGVREAGDQPLEERLAMFLRD